MFKNLIVAAAVLVSAGAQAAPTHYDFAWKGFRFISDTNVHWSPDATISGYFVGEDLDADGAIAIDEITRFGLRYGGHAQPWEFFGCPDRGPTSAFITDCSVGNFLYTADGELSFKASASWSFSGSTYNSLSWNAPTYFTNYDTDYPYNNTYSWYWTENTQLTVVAAVPEPSAWAMLAAGLAGIAGVARRRIGIRKPGAD